MIDLDAIDKRRERIHSDYPEMLLNSDFVAVITELRQLRAANERLLKAVWCVVHEEHYCYETYNTLVVVCGTEELANEWIAEQEHPRSYEAKEFEVLQTVGDAEERGSDGD